MNSSAEARLLADLARVPIMTIKVQEVGDTAVVYLWHESERIGVYSTIPAAVSVAQDWAIERGLPEPVIEMPCGTHIAASDFYEWYRKQNETAARISRFPNHDEPLIYGDGEPRRSVRVGAEGGGGLASNIAGLKGATP